MSNMVYLLTSTLLYCASASLPFIVTKSAQLLVAPFIGVFTAILWVLIARNVPQNDIPIWGLVYDIGIVLAFFFTPYLFIDRQLTLANFLGLGLVACGFCLVKV